MIRALLSASALALLAGAAGATPIALVLANEDYQAVKDVRRGDAPANAEDELRNAGVRVIAVSDGTAAEIAGALAEFGQMVGDADAILVVLSGRFVSSSTETYFLPTDTGPEPLATLPASSLQLSTVLAYLAETPGRAILALATDDADEAFGPLLRLGPGDLALPQGVTLVTGTPRQVSRFTANGVSQPSRRIAAAARAADLTISGFVASDHAFLEPEPETDDAPEPEPEPTGIDTTRADIRAWRNADAAGTAEAYQEYLDAFPGGQFRRIAESRIEALLDTPEARAESDEAALALSRDQRREIQRDLSLLDYNTRGIDGIFGRGTRAAIGQWQEANGFPSTGYLTREQITRLDAQAERRAAELELEAERRLQEQLAQDRAFWEETGATGDEAGLTAYLERFPDGQFADEARAELDRLQAEKRAETDALDRQLWDEAVAQDSIEAYRDYLEVAPNGAFRADAEARIRALEREAQQSDVLRRAQAEENALNLNAQSRRIVEQRLASVGLDPGRVDGTFDEDTRRAMRQYQRSRGLSETGYLSEAMVVRLLADSVRSIFD